MHQDQEQLISAAQPAVPTTEITPKRNKKTSYEASPDVQRWLKEQAAEQSGTKPAFEPTFLASQRDAPWVMSSLTHFYEEDLITDVLNVVRSGKEATVYCCAADPALNVEFLAAKIYRPRMFRSLRNDAVYRDNRPQSSWEGQRRQRHAPSHKATRGRAQQVSSWIAYEFETQQRLYECGVDLPRPLRQVGNALLMEYIGDQDGAAPLLKEVRLERTEAQPLFERLLQNIELCLANGRIHGDLSEYNLLYWQDSLILIDFAQAVDPHHNPDVFTLLQRDIERVCQHFARYGVEANAFDLATAMWTRQVGRFF